MHLIEKFKMNDTNWIPISLTTWKWKVFYFVHHNHLRESIQTVKQPTQEQKKPKEEEKKPKEEEKKPKEEEKKPKTVDKIIEKSPPEKKEKEKSILKQQNPVEKVLNKINEPVNPEAIEKFDKMLDALFDNDPSITVINMKDFPAFKQLPTATLVKDFIDAVESSTEITSLLLSDSTVDNSICTLLCNSLVNNTVLQVLDLSNNVEITDESCPAIINLIKNNASIQTLNLNGTSLSQGCWANILEALRDNKGIKSLQMNQHISPIVRKRIEMLLSQRNK